MYKGRHNSSLRDSGRSSPTWSGLCSRGQLSHWSPTPSMSVSLWSTLYTYWQLSRSLRIPKEGGVDGSWVLQPHIFQLNHTLSHWVNCLCLCKLFRLPRQGMPYHLHRCPQHRRLPLHCCLCLLGQGCGCRGSCHSGLPHHLCHSHTGLGCNGMGSCPEKRRNGHSMVLPGKPADAFNPIHSIVNPQRSAVAILYFVSILSIQCK